MTESELTIVRAQIPVETRERLMALLKTQGRTFSGWLRVQISDYLSQDKSAHHHQDIVDSLIQKELEARREQRDA